MSEQLRLAIRRPNDSRSGSEEKKMSRIALSPKATKLMKLCELEGRELVRALWRRELVATLAGQGPGSPGGGAHAPQFAALAKT